MIKGIKIGKKWVGSNVKPFIVAELSGNHNQSLERAFKIIDAAAEAGVDAIKLQTYTADTLMVKEGSQHYVINDERSLWHGMSMYELYQQAYTPWEWHEELFNYCKQLGLECFSSPFDDSAVDFLEKLGCPAYKIASTENTDLLLLRKVAQTGKPVIVSTGMATVAELAETVGTLKNSGCEDIILLKCTAAYPANPAHINLKTIAHLQELFGCQVGLSDHTMGVGVAVAGVALGAVMVEKHLTLARADGGVDSTFSMEPHEFSLLVKEAQSAWAAVGKVNYGAVEGENPNLARRSLYITKALKAGEKLSSENLVSKRPGFGMPVKHYEQVIGLRVNIDVAAGTPLSWELIKDE